MKPANNIPMGKSLLYESAHTKITPYSSRKCESKTVGKKVTIEARKTEKQVANKIFREPKYNLDLRGGAGIVFHRLCRDCLCLLILEMPLSPLNNDWD
jgi:hypothetical protein